MSLESIINQISDGVDAAFDAVEASGGTVPASRTMNNMATAVETVPEPVPPVPPTPGWDDPETDWGAVWYWDKWNENYSAGDMADGCEVTAINESKFATFVEENQLESIGGVGYEFMYEEGYDPETGEPTGQYVWMTSSMMGEVALTTAELASVAGISVSLDDPEMSAIFNIVKTITKAEDAETVCGELSENELPKFCNNGNVGGSYQIDGVMVPSEMIRRFVFGHYWKDWDGNRYTEPGTGRMDSQFLIDPAVESISPDTYGIIGHIGENFLQQCTNFDSSMSFPNAVSIGYSFLSECSSFNHPLDFSVSFPKCTSLGDGILYYCESFNQTFVLPSGITKVPNSVLSNCTSFNQPVTIPDGVTEIGYGFIADCPLFNQPLVIPSSVTKIGYSFLGGCTSFNQPLTLPNGLTTIEYSFIMGCTSFNQNLTIPNTVTEIQRSFLEKLESMTSTVYCECPTSVFSSIRTGDKPVMFATRKSSCPAYINGIKLAGTYKNDWKNMFPDNGYPYYRKLIVVS